MPKAEPVESLGMEKPDSDAYKAEPKAKPEEPIGSKEAERLVCHLCGREFSSKQALRAHLRWCKKKKRGEEGEETPPPSPRRRVEELEPYTIRDQLIKILIAAGLHQKVADAVADLVDDYGYSVSGIYEAMKDRGIRRSEIRYVIKRWAAERNERIPRSIWNEIQAGDEFYATYRYAGGYGSPHYEDEGAPPRRGEDPTLLHIGERLGRLEANLNSPRGGYDPVLKEALDKIGDALRLLAERQSHDDLGEIKERLIRLEASKELQLKKLEIEVQKEQIGLQKQWFQTIDKRLEALGRKGDKLISLLIAMGRPPASRPRGSVEEPGFEKFEGGEEEMSSNPLRGLRSYYDNATGKVIIFSDEEEEVRRRARSSPWLSTLLEQGRYLVRPSEEEQREMERMVEEVLPSQYIVEEGG